MKNEVYVGIDVSKNKVDLAIYPDGKGWSELQDEAGLERLVAELKESTQL